MMKEQKVSLEGQLESLKQATSGEEREKADLLNSEKKLRAQVCRIYHACASRKCTLFLSH